MKTREGWKKSGLPLTSYGDFYLVGYLQPGDEVDEELVEYFATVVAPACWSKTCIQIGEPTHFTEQGFPCFSTLERIKGKWAFTGNKPTPKEETCLFDIKETELW